MHFERIQHAFPGYDNLSGLFLDGQSPDESRDFFGSFPLGQLSEAFLARPSTGVYDFEVKLAVSRVEDKYGTVDRFSRQVALEGLMNSHSVNVGVVDEPDDLVREQFGVVLRVKVGFCGLGRVKLQPFANALSKHIQGGVGLELKKLFIEPS